MSHYFSRLLARLLLIVGVLAGFSAAAQALTLTQNPPNPTSTGVTYSNWQYFSAGGGAAPYTYQLTSISGSASDNWTSGNFVFASNGTLNGLSCLSNGVAKYTILVTDANGVSQSFSGNAFSVNVTTSPAGACGSLTLNSLSPPSTPVGTAYSQTNVASGGTGGPYKYSVAAGALPPGTTLDPNTGTVSGTPTTAGVYNYSIKAIDTSGNTKTNPIIATITAANSPALTSSAATGTLTVGGTITQNNTATGGTPGYTYSISAGTLPPGTSINSTNGTVTGTPTIAGTYNYTVQVVDSLGKTATSSVSVTIAPALAMDSSAPSGTVVDGTYSQTNTASGGKGPYTYSIIGGALPTGTTLNPDGTVTGTPTTPGAFTYTVQALDANGNTVSNVVSGTIADAGVLVLNSAAPNGATVGSNNYDQENIASGGTGGPYTYSFTGTLPPGTTLNTSTGQVTGNPTTAGTYNYTITATDGTNTTSNPVTAVIGKGTQAPLNLTAASSAISTTQTTTVSATGGSGDGNVTYSVVSGPCSVNATTGVVTPTGTAGTCVLQATKAADANYNEATSNQVQVTITAGSQPVTPEITLSTSSNAIKTNETATLTVGNFPNASTGALSYTVTGPCTVSGNTSPATLTPTGAGVCTVTATQAGDATYAPFTTPPVTVTVTAPSPLTLGPASIPAGTTGVPYSQTFTASGGIPGYNYSIDNLPPGLTFTNGVLSGVPTTGGTFTFNVCVTDSSSPAQRTCQPYTLNIAGGYGITTNSLPTPTLGAPYSQPVVVAGAVGAVTYAITAGALPAGLSLNPTTGVISGNSLASGCYNFTVTATDTGRVAPLNTTSKSYSFCVTRPDPSQDANVRGIISSQARAAYRFVRGQIALIQSHLDHLHDDDDAGDSCSDPNRPSAVQDFCVEFDNKVQIRGAERALSGQERDAQDLRKLNDVAALADPTGVSTRNQEQQRLTQNQIEKQSKVASVDPMINTTNNTQDSHLGAADPNMRNFSALAVERSSNYPARTAGQAPEIVGPTPKIKGGVKVNVWTAGEVDFGRYDNQGRLLNEKFNVGSLAVGADMRVMPGLRAGVAFGYGNDYAQINYGLANSQAQNFSATGYASYRIAPGIFVDGLFGYGDLHYFSNRLGGDGTNISGNRNGYALFQSLALTVEKRYGGFKFAPYVRVDGGQVYLNGYTEMGSREWALSYNGANTNTVDAVAGIRTSYDYKLLNGGVITPNARAQFQKFFTSSVSQWMNYAIDPSMSYNYFDMGQLQWMFMGTLGTQYTFDNVSAGVDYVVTTSGARYLTNGVRANIRVHF